VALRQKRSSQMRESRKRAPTRPRLLCGFASLKAARRVQSDASRSRMLHHDPLRFDAPPGWTDEATLVLSPADGRREEAITVTRELLAPDGSAHTHVDLALGALARHLDDLEVLARHERVVAGRSAALRHVRWQSARGPMEQAIAAVESSRHGRRIVYLLAASAPAAGAPAMRARFEGMLRTLRLDIAPMPHVRAEAR
jgi:hypothetical protein